jgi:hypothetical protein
MSFCKDGLKKAKEVLKKLTPELENIITSVLQVTGAIMGNQAWSIIEALLMQLPNGSKLIEGVITGVNALTEVESIIQEPDWKKKLQLFISYVSILPEFNSHAKLVKFASILTGILHGNQHDEKTYDTLTQAKTL